MPCCTLAYAQPPAAIPPQGIGPLESAYEQAVDAGTARDPQPDDPIGKGDPTQTAPDASILNRPLGLFKRALNPVPTLLQFRRYDGAADPGNDGAHAELLPGVSIPPQGMEPTSELRGNTWRAAPQPWDSAFYIGDRSA